MGQTTRNTPCRSDDDLGLRVLLFYSIAQQVMSPVSKTSSNRIEQKRVASSQGGGLLKSKDANDGQVRPPADLSASYAAYRDLHI